MSNTYVLVNPYIQGNMKNKIKANNSNIAAKQLYQNLSEHFNNAVPQFNFTIQKGGSGEGKYYHFQTTEIKNKNDVNFTIKSFDIKAGNLESFKERLSKCKNNIQNGGKKDKKSKKSKKHKKKSSDSSDSESDDSSDSNLYVKTINTYKPLVNQPINYWWYDPYVYNLDSIFIPTFYPYITPLIEYSLVNVLI